VSDIASRSCPQQDVVDYCRAKGIVVTAYSPLGSDGSPLQKNPIVVKLAEKYNVQPANILVSLQANRPGVNVIPKVSFNLPIFAPRLTTFCLSVGHPGPHCEQLHHRRAYEGGG
jgi:hypothetical protein